MNEKFQNAIALKAQKVPPIWFMRQAGRYHSHYQRLRARHSFEELCRQSELAAQVALGPIQDFDFDVAILFSDLLFPLDALGMGLSYGDGGPALKRKIDTLKDIAAFPPANDVTGELEFQGQAIARTRAELPKSKSLIGFTGGLWTLFVYACEGGHQGGLLESKKRLPLFPAFVRAALPLVQYCISTQLAAGAESVLVIDTAAGELSPPDFATYVAPTLNSLARAFPKQLGYYAKGAQSAHFATPEWNGPWAGLGFDHRWDICSLLKSEHSGFVQGNFDQTLLHLPTADYHAALDRWLAPLELLTQEQRRGWVCGIGHGLLPHTPEAHVRYFVETIRRRFA
jgi:uroporphyrinogen decarboxylase